MTTLNDYNKKLNLSAGSMLITVCVFLLISCGSNQGDDLDQFMSTAANDMQPKIDPIPEVKPYTATEFNADSQLNDPFKARKAKNSSTGGIQPNLVRPKEALEAYPLESLKYVGLLAKQKLTYALIKTPDGNLQQVKIGNYLGQNFGIITEISDSSVTLKEIVQDDLTGDWTDRTSSINLQE
ncbi:MAG: pilus assembly protein PilP [Methylophilaceae bacterium]|nr:pilus assembly protein PilP [Methyloradius sp.]